MKFMAPVVLASIALVFVSCGSPDSGSSVKSDEFYNTHFKCEESSTQYQALVTAGQNKEAIQYVCSDFGLECGSKSISYSASLSGAYAQTNSLTNSISVGASAFRFASCGVPHDGWLAAVIGHEILHTTQSSWARWKAATGGAYFGQKAAMAKLEIPAWSHMRDNADRYHLTSRMRIEVVGQIEEYTADLR